MRKRLVTYMKIPNDGLPLYLYLTVLILMTVPFISTFVSTYSHPFDTEQGESYVLRDSINFYENGFDGLYTEADEKPLYVTNDYTPLFYIFVSSLFPLLGKVLVTGRLISFISSIGIALLIYLIVRKEVEDRVLGLVGSLFFLSTNIVLYWGTIFRVDMLALLFTVLGLYFLVYRSEKYSLYISVVFFTLAVYTKQIFIAAPLASIIYVYMNRRERFRKFTVSLFSLIFIPGLILNYITSGAFVSNTIIYNLTFSYGQSGMGLGGYFPVLLTTFSIPIFLCILYFARNRDNIWGLYFSVALLTGIFMSLNPESWSNYFLEVAVASSVIIPLMLKEFMEEDRWKIFLGVVLLLTVIHIPMNLNGTWDSRTVHMGSEYVNEDVDTYVFSYVNKSRGNVLVENIGYGVRTGNVNYPEFVGMKELIDTGVVHTERFSDYCTENSFTYIMYRNPARVPYPIKECIDDRYKLIDEGERWYSWSGEEEFWRIYGLKNLSAPGWKFRSGWYLRETSDDRSWRWMEDSSLLDVIHGNETELQMSFDVWSFYEPRELRMSVDNRTLGVWNISDKETVSVSFESSEEKSTVQFRSLDGCDVPLEVLNSGDERCLSFAFSKIEMSGKN